MPVRDGPALAHTAFKKDAGKTKVTWNDWVKVSPGATGFADAVDSMFQGSGNFVAVKVLLHAV